MSKGWISIHRKLQNHWLWEDLPFSKGQAWIDLLMLANHEDAKFLLGNQLVEVNRGDVVTSEVKLMARWGWSNTKVRSFLNLLEKDSMIIKKTDSKKSALTLTGYSVWQDTKSEKEVQQKCNKSATKVQQHTINNTNNKNNSNNSNKGIYTPDESEVLSTWNSNGIINHSESETLKKEIAKSLKAHNKEMVILAINQYSTLLHDSDFYYSNKFTLSNFLKQKNGLPNFLSDGQMWINYVERGNKNGFAQKAISQIASGEAEDDPEWPISNSTTRRM